MKKMWNTYQKKFRYAGILWDDIMWSVRKLSVEANLNVEKPSVLERIKYIQKQENNSISTTAKEKEHER